MNKQRTVFAAALALILVIGFFGAAQGQTAAKGAAGKGPVAVVAVKTVQLGEVTEGQDFGYTFKVKNAGNAELQIINVRPG